MNTYLVNKIGGLVNSFCCDSNFRVVERKNPQDVGASEGTKNIETLTGDLNVQLSF